MLHSYVTILFEPTGARDSIDESALTQILSEMTTEDIGVGDAMLKPEVLQLTNYLKQLYQTASCLSRTAKLSIQYDEQVSLMQQFVRAERSGYFALYLHVIAQMRPYYRITVRKVISSNSANYGRSRKKDAISRPKKMFSQWLLHNPPHNLFLVWSMVRHDYRTRFDVGDENKWGTYKRSANK